MSKQLQHVIDFAATGPAPVVNTSETPAFTEVSIRHFADAAKGAVAGIWESDAYVADEVYDYDELCHILEGEVRLTDENGTQQVFRPGDSFVITAGFRGRWENLSPVRKVYFVLRSRP